MVNPETGLTYTQVIFKKELHSIQALNYVAGHYDDHYEFFEQFVDPALQEQLGTDVPDDLILVYIDFLGSLALTEAEKAQIGFEPIALEDGSAYYFEGERVAQRWLNTTYDELPPYEPPSFGTLTGMMINTSHLIYNEGQLIPAYNNIAGYLGGYLYEEFGYRMEIGGE